MRTNEDNIYRTIYKNVFQIILLIQIDKNILLIHFTIYNGKIYKKYTIIKYFKYIVLKENVELILFSSTIYNI